MAAYNTPEETSGKNMIEVMDTLRKGCATRVGRACAAWPNDEQAQGGDPGVLRHRKVFNGPVEAINRRLEPSQEIALGLTQPQPLHLEAPPARRRPTRDDQRTVNHEEFVTVPPI